MEIVIKIIQAVLPLIIDLIREHHTDKTTEEHHDILKKLINDQLSK